jgi:hypothetical protein
MNSDTSGSEPGSTTQSQYLALLSGEVRFRDIYGPWGDTPPSGYYLELTHPVILGGTSYREVYLGRVSILATGRRTFFGHLIERVELRLASTVRYLELAWPPGLRRVS